MKKIAICLVLAIALSNCEISVKKVKAEGGPYELVPGQGIANNGCMYVYKSFRGMDYLIMCGNPYETGAPSITVVNLTKDELEVELLKKQLGKK